MKIYLVLILITLIGNSCSFDSQETIQVDVSLEWSRRKEDIKLEKLDYPKNCDGYPDPSNQDPLEYLANLRWRECEGYDYFVINPDEIPLNWVKEEHLPKLYSQLWNEDIAYPIASSYASLTYGKKGFTTIARHAYLLIRFYQGAHYPPYHTFPESITDTLKLSEAQQQYILNGFR